MSQRAHVTSIEALESFRSKLIVCLEKITTALDDVSDDAQRTHTWITLDQQRHWESEIHRRSKRLEMAQQELFSSRISSLETSTLDKQMAVKKAKLALLEAEEKLAHLKKWARAYESQMGPLAKQIDKARGMVATDMGKAVLSLTQTVKLLDDYAHMAPSGSEPATSMKTAPAPEPQTEETGAAPVQSEAEEVNPVTPPPAS